MSLILGILILACLVWAVKVAREDSRRPAPPEAERTEDTLVEGPRIRWVAGDECKNGCRCRLVADMDRL